MEQQNQGKMKIWSYTVCAILTITINDKTFEVENFHDLLGALIM